MKKSRKRNAIVLALIVLLIATAIGYAAFASSLEITGSATAYGEWDVHFANASISKSDTNNSVQITDGGVAATTGDGLEVSVQLDYPGESATVTVDIVNDSTCAAVLNGLTIEAEDDGTSATLTPTSNTWTDGVLQMQLNHSNFTDSNGSETTIASNGGTTSYELVFTWVDDESTSADLTANFGITMNFAQPTP